jgi:hypothetical protein
MNQHMREHTIFHLEEAIEQMQATIKRLKSDPEYSAGTFEVEMGHTYHHLNYAWNTRRARSRRVWKHSTREFYQYRQMPKDVEFLQL